MKSALEIFFCCASEDESLRENLEKQLQTLRRYGLIDALWHSQSIIPGAEVDHEISKHLNLAQVILLLISPDFMKSNDCYTIMSRAMERHERREAHVIPIILRPVDWKEAPFGRLKVLPTNEKAVTTWSNLDEALYDVATGIRKAIEYWTGESSISLPTTTSGTSNTALTISDPMEFSFALVRTLTEHLGPVASVAFSSDGDLLVSDSWDNTIKIWDRDAGQVLYTFRGHTGAVYSVIFSSDVASIASGSDDRTIKIWDVRRGQELRTLTGHTEPVSSVAFSSDMSTVISGSDDRTIKIWDVRRGQELRTLTGHTGPVSSVAFSSDMTTLVSGSYDKTIKVWDMRSGKVINNLVGHAGPVSSVTFSSDMTTLVSGSHDKTIKVWDMRSGKVRCTLTAHLDPISSIALSPDAGTLVSGSYDKTIKVWDIATGQMLGELTGHAEAVLSVAFHPNGRIIASGSLDKTIKIWQRPHVKTGNKNANVTTPSYNAKTVPVPPKPSSFNSFSPMPTGEQRKNKQWFDPTFWRNGKNRLFVIGWAIVDLIVAIVISREFTGAAAWNIPALCFLVAVGLRVLCAWTTQKWIAQLLLVILPVYWAIGSWFLVYEVYQAFHIQAISPFIIASVVLVVGLVVQMSYASRKR